MGMFIREKCTVRSVRWRGGKLDLGKGKWDGGCRLGTSMSGWGRGMRRLGREERELIGRFWGLGLKGEACGSGFGRLCMRGFECYYGLWELVTRYER